jgi:O-antigen ligase
VNALSKLAALEPAIALVIGGAVLALLLWISWRKPTLVFLLALAALALRPQLLWGGPDVDSAWGLSQSLVLFGLALNALRYGVRRTINWPILALILVLGLNLAFGNLHPKLTLAFMLGSLAVLALPFAFTQVVLAPGSRPIYAAVIMLTPLLSVVLAVLLDVADIRPLTLLGWSNHARFEGATGNAAVFAMLGFSGLVVALHESTRPGRGYAGPLAALNFVLVVITITRMAVLASLVFALAYALLSEDLRAQWRAHRTQALLILGVAIGALALCWQTVEGRMFVGPDDEINMPGRQDLWPFYYQEFLFSPIVGRGLGAGFVAAADWLPGLTAPHNEYLHLLVNGGVVGFVLVAGAIVLWYRDLLRLAAPGDRPCLLALIPAIALYSVTDNPSFYSSALPIYAYLGVLLTRSPVAAPMSRSRALTTVAGARPSSPDPSDDRRRRQALARMRATSEAVERVTSRRSR